MENGTQGGSPGFLRPKSYILLLLLVSSVLFLPVLKLPFLFDDAHSVADNAFLRDFSQAKYLFTGEYTRVSLENSFEPLTTLYLMTLGPAAKWVPPGFHAANVLIHTGNSILVFFIGLNFFSSSWAFLAALLFLIHPVQYEAVAGAYFAGTLLSTFFCLLGLLLFLSLDEKSGAARKITTGFLFAVSLLFKERAFFAVPLIYLFYSFKRPGLRAFLRAHNWDTAVVTLSWALYSFARLKFVTAGRFETGYLDFSFLPCKLALYSKIILFPMGLSPVYSCLNRLPGLPALIASAAFITVLVLASRNRGGRGTNYFNAGLIIFIGGLLPVLNILPQKELSGYLGRTVIANRYLYLPMCGFVLLFAGAIKSALEYFRSVQTGIKVVLPAVILYCALLSSLLVYQLLLWQNEENGWKRAAKINPNSPAALFTAGTFDAKKGNIPEARRWFLEARQVVKPEDADLACAIELGLGNLEFSSGNNGGALTFTHNAIKIWPLSRDAWNNLGVLLAAEGKTQEALDSFAKAASLDAGWDQPLYNIGKLYMMYGQPREALEYFKKAYDRMPSPLTRETIKIALQVALTQEQKQTNEPVSSHRLTQINTGPETLR